MCCVRHGPARGLRMSRIITRLLPLLLLVLFQPGSAGAQQPDHPPNLDLGDAVVTGFSGTLAPDAANTPGEQIRDRSHFHQPGRTVGPHHQYWPTGICLGRPAACRLLRRSMCSPKTSARFSASRSTIKPHPTSTSPPRQCSASTSSAAGTAVCRNAGKKAAPASAG